MDKKELDEGMKDAKKKSDEKEGKATENGGGEGASEWAPSIDWVMNSVGPFFNNNRGLGELLLDEINKNGINTEGIALASMVGVLQQFNKEYKELGQAIGNNLDRIDALSAQSEDLANAVKQLITEMGVSEEDGASLPLDEPDMSVPPPDMSVPPPDMGGEMPPPDMGGEMPPDGMGAPVDMGAPPATDMGAAMPPDMGGAPMADMGGAMPTDMGAPVDMNAMPPPDMAGNIPSDENIKEVKRGVLSDEQLKRVAKGMSAAMRRKRTTSKLSPNIISACDRRDM